MGKPKSNEYFISKGHEMIFALVETDGVVRTKLIGITDKMYYSKKLAKNWRDRIFSIIMSDAPDHPRCQDAIDRLNKFYDSMTEDE